MSYTKTAWVDDSSPYISAANLNHLETGVYDAAATADAATASAAAAQADATLALTGPVGTSQQKANGQPGVFTGPLSGTTMTAANIVANRAYFVRFVPPKNMTVAKIAIAVATSATSADSSDVGIYNSSGTLLGSTGSTAIGLNSTGAKVYTLPTPIALTAGTVYYIAFAYGTIGGTAANIVGTNGAFGNSQMMGNSPPNAEWFVISSCFPLVTKASFTGFAVNGAVPLFAVRES